MSKLEPPKSWDLNAPYAIVVPAYDETYNTVYRLLNSIDSRALVILVINRSPTSPWTVARANERLLEELPKIYAHKDEHEDMLFCSGKGVVPRLLIVDRTSEGRTITNGVGEARRIGCDLLFDLQSCGKIESEWIHNTDADSILPFDYFTAAEAVYQDNRRSAICMRGVNGFTNDPECEAAVQIDSLCSSFVSASLSRTAAPWPVTISGCGMAVSHWAYYFSGGVQPYKVAEDGHLVNSAGKLGLIHRVYGQRILTEARETSRPPAGYADTISGLRKQIEDFGHKPKTLSHPAAYAHADAFYKTIEHCLVGKKRVSNACEQACVEAYDKWGFEMYVDKVREAIDKLVGPIDDMFQHMNPIEAYLQIHRAIDLRGTLRVVIGFGRKLWPQVDWSEALRLSPWLKASVYSDDLGKALFVCQRDEAEACAGTWGALAGAERLFGKSTQGEKDGKK
jgi:hypothetical protein